jgi:hypothetical protein
MLRKKHCFNYDFGFAFVFFFSAGLYNTIIRPEQSRPTIVECNSKNCEGVGSRKINSPTQTEGLETGLD